MIAAPPKPSSSVAAARDAAWAACSFMVVSAVVAWYGGNAAGDDTFIYMRYVGNALAGRGYVFNPGETSSGITSPLWAMAMTPVAGLLGNTVAVWKATSTLIAGARAALLFLLFRRRFCAAPRKAALLTALVALEPHGLRWASSGMENALAQLFLVGAAWKYFTPLPSESDKGSAGLGAMIAALAVVRPEFTLMAAALVVAARPSRKSLARIVGSCVATYFCFAFAFALAFGSSLPQTAEAKAIVLGQAYPLAGLWGAARVTLSGAGGALALLFASLASGRPDSESAPDVRGWTIAALLASLGIVGFLSWRHMLVSTRYGVSLCTPLVMAAAFQLAALDVAALRGRVIQAAVAIQCALSVAILVYVFPITRNAETSDIRRFVEATEALVPADARVATTEVGAYGFFSDRYVIDLLGLVDTESLALIRRLGNPNRSRALLEEVLVARRATHHISCFGRGAPIQGTTLDFELLYEQDVVRNNFSGGRPTVNHWRLYRVESRAP